MKYPISKKIPRYPKIISESLYDLFRSVVWEITILFTSLLPFHPYLSLSLCDRWVQLFSSLHTGLGQAKQQGGDAVGSLATIRRRPSLPTDPNPSASPGAPYLGSPSQTMACGGGGLNASGARATAPHGASEVTAPGPQI